MIKPFPVPLASLQLVNNSYAGELYVLYQCGVAAPPVTGFPSGTKFFAIPLSAMSVTDTSAYAFLVSPQSACQVVLQACIRVRANIVSFGHHELQ